MNCLACKHHKSSHRGKSCNFPARGGMGCYCPDGFVSINKGLYTENNVHMGWIGTDGFAYPKVVYASDRERKVALAHIQQHNERHIERKFPG